eukprot:EC124559.1.p1 GENE.EC124559.1~~EC124559.1.p1  ORF type:complete len:181 (-),score=44.03 EC124559.1:81-623(-)
MGLPATEEHFRDTVERRRNEASSAIKSVHLTTTLLGHTDGATTAAGGLRVLATDAQAPVVSKAAVATDLAHHFQVLSKLVVELIGDSLAESPVLDVLPPVEHPVGNLELPRVLKDGHNPFNFFHGHFTGALVQVHIGLLAHDVGEAAAATLDGRQGVGNLARSINVRVEAYAECAEKCPE